MVFSMYVLCSFCLFASVLCTWFSMYIQCYLGIKPQPSYIFPQVGFYDFHTITLYDFPQNKIQFECTVSWHSHQSCEEGDSRWGATNRGGCGPTQKARLAASYQGYYRLSLFCPWIGVQGIPIYMYIVYIMHKRNMLAPYGIFLPPVQIF